ncbi:kinase-like domain-containing protein [Zopfochytrium polystomum]|nr:kinase-like domain-containing protein [Zopfochytrium polystomum]
MVWGGASRHPTTDSDRCSSPLAVGPCPRDDPLHGNAHPPCGLFPALVGWPHPGSHTRAACRDHSMCDYKVKRNPLGTGSYALVKLAIKVSTGEKFAAKIIKKVLVRGREAMFQNEVQILKRVSKGHRNIVTLHDHFETESSMYLIMDYCTGGELFHRLIQRGTFYEDDAADIIKTVVGAVAYLHDQNIVHRDIKAENLLFRTRAMDSDLVIADFGLSQMLDPNMEDLTTSGGTLEYMAPEVLMKRGHGKPVDMWSIGVLSYFLLCGYTPFGSVTTNDIRPILNGSFAFEPADYWFDVSSEAKDFINRLIVVDPSQRMTAHDALMHPWLGLGMHVDGDGGPGRKSTVDLLPNVRRHFVARRGEVTQSPDTIEDDVAMAD